MIIIRKQEPTADPTNMTINIPIASNTPAADIDDNKNFESVLNITIQTASFTVDSPYLEIRKNVNTNRIIVNIGSASKA